MESFLFGGLAYLNLDAYHSNLHYKIEFDDPGMDLNGKINFQENRNQSTDDVAAW